MPKHTFSTSSNSLQATREALRFCRMLAREAAATADSDGATKAALESVVSALSCEILDLDDAAEEDGIQREWERDSQRSLPFYGAPA